MNNLIVGVIVLIIIIAVAWIFVISPSQTKVITVTTSIPPTTPNYTTLLPGQNISSGAFKFQFGGLSSEQPYKAVFRLYYNGTIEESNATTIPANSNKTFAPLLLINGKIVSPNQSITLYVANISQSQYTYEWWAQVRLSQVMHKAYSTGSITCNVTSSQYNCTPATVFALTHSYLNGNTGKKVNGTFVSLNIGQSTGQNWENVKIAYVPQGSQLNFSNSQQMGEIAGGIYTGGSTPVNLLHISNNSQGIFTGQIWFEYNTSNSSTLQIIHYANLTVNAP